MTVILLVWCSGREVERWPQIIRSQVRFPGAGVNLGTFVDPHIRREYWCSSQEAESREISVSCKNFFLNQCEINMFKLVNYSLVESEVKFHGNINLVKKCPF